MGKYTYSAPFIFFDQDGTLNQWRWIDVSIVRREGYFRTVLPHTNVIEAAAILNRKFLIGTYGAVWQDGHSQADKDWWMDAYCSFIPLERRFYVPCGTEKASFFRELIGRPITKADILVDDNSDVLRAWEKYGGTGVKVVTPENSHHGTWKGFSFPYDASPESIAAYLIAVRGVQTGIFKALV